MVDLSNLKKGDKLRHLIRGYLHVDLVLAMWVGWKSSHAK